MYIYINNDEYLEYISMFDKAEHELELIRLSLVGDNYDNLKNAFIDEEIIFGTILTIKTSTLIYMDATFYYIAALEAEGITYLSFNDGLTNIVNYMNKNKSLL